MSAAKAKKKRSSSSLASSFPNIYDAESEANLLASILMDASWLEKITVDPSDFSVYKYQLTYEIMLDLKARGQEINHESVALGAETLNLEDENDRIQAWETHKMVADLPTAVNCDYYAERVHDLAQRRRLIGGIYSLMSDAGNIDIVLDTTLDKIANFLKAMPWPTPASRVVEFKDGVVLTTSPPKYIWTIAHKDKEARLRFNSDELDSKQKFKRRIREVLHINAYLQERWDDFINKLVSEAKKEEAPVESKTDSEICYWVREWYRTCTEAQISADLDRGWKFKGDHICFQPEPVCKWLRNNAKIQIDPANLWAVLQEFGAKKGLSVRISKQKSDTRKLWGAQKTFFAVDGADSDIDLEDLSWMDEWEKEPE